MKTNDHVRRARGARIALLVTTLASGAASAMAPSGVADPRPAHHVVDLTGTLGPDDVAAVDAAAERASSNGELLVVVVPSVDGVDARGWTTELFNRLGVDATSRNRGVVLMAALEDRDAEIVVGDGYDASAATRLTDHIMSDVVVAHFKSGDARGAIVSGAEALADDVVVARPPELAAPARAAADDDADDDDGNPLFAIFAGLGGVTLLILAFAAFVAFLARGSTGSSSSGSSWSNSTSSSFDSGSSSFSSGSSGSGSSGHW